MTLSKLVFRSMRKNVKQYFLYFFALIFSVTFCFSFTTLQHNPTVVKALEKSGTASAGFGAATFVLYIIVMFFVFYANQLFMKRRSKEIGLYQLIGMTKGLIVRLIVLENIILFVLAVSVGMVLGFLSSRLFAMILVKMMGVEYVIELAFSMEAFKQSVIVFSVLLMVILIQTTIIVYRVTLLQLFQASKKTDERIKRFNLFHMLMGVLGILLIVYGYYQSTILFTTESKYNDIMLHMIVILATTIFGTFLFFQFSVAFLMNLIRGSKKGHLSITDVMAITPVMHRMKSNAKSLTLITTLTGLAVGIMTLSYISYYSSEVRARQYSPFDYILINNQGIEYLDRLDEEGIEYEKYQFNISHVSYSLLDLMKDFSNENFIIEEESTMYIIPLSDFKQISAETSLKDHEVILASFPDWLSNIISVEENMKFPIKYNNQEMAVEIKEVRKEYVLSGQITYMSPIMIVSDSLFQTISKEQEGLLYSQIGINIGIGKGIDQAEEIYNELAELRKVEVDGVEITPTSYHLEREEFVGSNASSIFISAFLGLAFLLTTGSILYFKQMAEAEDEQESYTILRKIGFSTSDLMKGIIVKQLYNFGVPLLIGILHSYFAVKSGWFLFGTELKIPLIVIVTVYVALYGCFALLSTQYYKKVILRSL